MARLTGLEYVEVVAMESENLDTVCYRGSAPLSYLAIISQADVFDQVSNPEGLQRDLSPKHASDAYDYVSRKEDKEHPRAYPEIVLNVRDINVVKKESLTSSNSSQTSIYRLRFDLKAMEEQKRVFVSRVDGNHRLFHAAGDKNREPLELSVPFQIHMSLTTEQERSLFVDINSNQKPMNTSHLAVMMGKLTEEEREIRDHPERWIAKRLTEDATSPWHGMVHMGGSNEGGRAQGLTRYINFVSLVSGVDKTYRKSQYIRDFTDIKAQYAIIKNYWIAVKNVFSIEWASPKKYLLLKNIGVNSFSILGGTIIDRCVPKKKVGVEDFSFYLKQVQNTFNWAGNAEGAKSVSGMMGNQAAMIVAAEMAKDLTDETGENAMRDLEQMLLGEDTSM